MVLALNYWYHLKLSTEQHDVDVDDLMVPIMKNFRQDYHFVSTCDDNKKMMTMNFHGQEEGNKIECKREQILFSVILFVRSVVF